MSPPAASASATQSATQAASRKPRFQALRADGRDDVHRLADEGHSVAPGHLGGQPGQGKDAARADLRHGAQQPLQPLLERCPDCRIVETGKVRGKQRGTPPKQDWIAAPATARP